MAQVQLHANRVRRRQRHTAARTGHRGTDVTNRPGHATMLQLPSALTGRERAVASERGRIDRNAFRTTTRCNKLTASLFISNPNPTFTSQGCDSHMCASLYIRAHPFHSTHTSSTMISRMHLCDCQSQLNMSMKQGNHCR